MYKRYAFFPHVNERGTGRVGGSQVGTKHPRGEPEQFSAVVRPFVVLDDDGAAKLKKNTSSGARQESLQDTNKVNELGKDTESHVTDDGRWP